MAARQMIAHDHADDIVRVQQVVHAGGEQRDVEIGPEPGDEEHHLRGDEQDHAVTEVQLHDRRMIAVPALADDIAPPEEAVMATPVKPTTNVHGPRRPKSPSPVPMERIQTMSPTAMMKAAEPRPPAMDSD